MRFHSFLIKYGEIGIKGKNRYLFEDALVRQIRFALKDVDGEFNVHKAQGRVYVDCEGEYDYEETVESLKRVFGIVGICPVVRLQDNGFEQLKKDVEKYIGEVYPEKNQTFKIEAPSSNPSTLSSIESLAERMITFSRLCISFNFSNKARPLPSGNIISSKMQS